MPEREGDPKPDNLDAMTAAYVSGDPVAIAREKAIYNAQLIAAGRAPLYEMHGLWEEK